MATKYPSQIDTTQTLPSVVDLQTPVQAKFFNQLRDTVIAVESALGVNPAGTAGTTAARIGNIETALGNITDIFGIDLQESVNGQLVVGLRGRPLSTTTPTVGQFLGWDGISWGSTTFSGDLKPIASAQVVIGLQGNPVSSTAPTSGQVLQWNGTSWIPGVGFTASRDLSGTPFAQTVIGLQGRPLLATAPTVGQILEWNGSAWAPTSAGVAFMAGGDLSGSATSQTVIGIQNNPVLSTSPSANTFLGWNGTQWAPLNPINTGANTQVLFDNSGAISGSSHLTFDSTSGGLAAAADGTGFISVGNTNLPASGDVRVNNAFLMRANNGTSDVTLINYSGISDVLNIGVNADLATNACSSTQLYAQSEVNIGTVGGGILLEIFGTTTRWIGSLQHTSAGAGAGAIALANNEGIFANSFNGLANISLIATDTSNDVIIGDTTNALNTVVRSASIAALEPGSAFFEMQSTGLISVSQSSATLTGTSFGQMIFDTHSRPICADDRNNQMQMAVVAQTLGGDNLSTSLLLTSLSFSMGAFETWVVYASVLCKGTSSAGVNLGWTVPANCTVIGSYHGAQGSANAYENPVITNGVFSGNVTQITDFANATPRLAQGSFMFNTGSTAGTITLTTTPTTGGQLVGILQGSSILAVQAIQE